MVQLTGETGYDMVSSTEFKRRTRKRGSFSHFWDVKRMSKIPFYNSPAWRKARIAALIRDRYLCQDCMKEKKIKKADTVHHIEHLRDRPDLALKLSNLISVCNRCHERRHPDRNAKEKPRQIEGVHIVKL